MSRRSGCGCFSLLGFVATLALGVTLCLAAQHVWARYKAGEIELPAWLSFLPEDLFPSDLIPENLTFEDLIPTDLVPRDLFSGHEDTPTTAPQDVSSIDEDGMWFAALTDDRKLAYAQMYEGIRSLKESFEVSGILKEDVEPTFRAVLADHPELFWLDGSTSYTYYMDGGPITITPNLNMGLDEVEATRAQIEAVADEFIATVPADADDYTKALRAYEYVINTTDYDAFAEHNQTIQSVLLGHSSVCAGYARAYMYLLERMGVPCAYVSGTMPSKQQEHAWNLVCLDGTYTYVDVTWGDPTFEVSTDAVPTLSYDYFGLTTAELEGDDHRFDDPSMWPICESTACSYYAREGLLFDSYDPVALSESFWRQVSAGRDAVSFKFSDEDAYVAARDAQMSGEFLADDIAQTMYDAGTYGSTYQYQYSDQLHILKLYL